MSNEKTRITPMHTIEIPGLGSELAACTDKEAEFFAVEELQADGSWLTVTEHATRAEAAQ